MKTLITGAGGQIGTDLSLALLEQGYEVVASDLALPAKPAATRVQWRVLDVTNREQVDAVIAEVAPDAVFHLAAILSARGEEDIHLTYDVNQNGTYYVLDACHRHRVKQLLYTSTIAVYGPGLPDPAPDDVPLHPTTMYGVTKVGNELLADYYRVRHGLDVRGVRFPGLISAILPGGGTSDYALFMYTEAIRTGRYQAFCRSDTRIPIMYMPDGVRALIELANAPRERLGRGVYNVAAMSPRADEIAASVSRAVAGVAITFSPDPMRQAILDSWPDAVDDRCARRDWGWQPAYDLEQMTADLVPKVRALMAQEGLEIAPGQWPGDEPIVSEPAG